MTNTSQYLMRPLADQRQGLVDLMSRLPDGLIVAEIGSYLGESAELMLESGKVKAIFCIDPWQNGYDEKDEASSRCPMSLIEAAFDERMARFSNVDKVKSTSQKAAIRYPEGFFDLVYIDGMHTYDAVKSDIEHFRSKVKPGGWIAGHDWGWAGLTDAVIECLGQPDETFVDGSWIKVRSAGFLKAASVT